MERQLKFCRLLKTTHTKAIRFELGNRVRHQLRIIPELNFHHDKTLDYLENIDNLLKK